MSERQKGASLQAILFDHDGTLINSEATHLGLWQQTLAPFGVTLTEDYYNRVMAGVPVAQNAIDLVRDFSLPSQPHTLADHKLELTHRFLQQQPFPLMPGAAETLKTCFDAGVTLAIVTGGSRFSVERTLSCYGLGQYISTIVAVEDVTHSKPAPDCYLKALEQLNCEAEQSLAIEDTEHGLWAAVAAGLPCIAIPTAQSVHHDFSKAVEVQPNLLTWLAAEGF
jgi:HAD superfamily hydrolase (TIGR01509 family)